MKWRQKCLHALEVGDSGPLIDGHALQQLRRFFRKQPLIDQLLGELQR